MKRKVAAKKRVIFVEYVR